MTTNPGPASPAEFPCWRVKEGSNGDGICTPDSGEEIKATMDIPHGLRVRLCRISRGTWKRVEVPLAYIRIWWRRVFGKLESGLVCFEKESKWVFKFCSFFTLSSRSPVFHKCSRNVTLAHDLARWYPCHLWNRQKDLLNCQDAMMTGPCGSVWTVTDTLSTVIGFPRAANAAAGARCGAHFPGGRRWGVWEDSEASPWCWRHVRAG